MSATTPLTPMMKQWFDLKRQAQDALLFFRLGDFYELFEEDAIRGAPVLGVVLTSRNNRGNGETSPLCGIPISNFELYLNRALEAGLKVALAEQMEAPQGGKNIVRREIVQWFTPGIRLLPNEEKSHYAAVVAGRPESWVCAAGDVATGHVVLESGEGAEALQEVIERLPIEDLRVPFGQNFPVRVRYQETAVLLHETEAENAIFQHLQIASRDDLPTENKMETQALGSLLKILKEAHPSD